MRLKVHNSKSSLMILIFLYLNISESSSQDSTHLYDFLKVESITQTNWNTSDYNLDLKIGLSYDVLNRKWYDNDFFVEKADFLQIGYNHNGTDDFLSFNLLKYEDILSDSAKNIYTSIFKSKSIDLILVNRDCIKQKEVNWIKLGLGIGYDFLKNHENLLLAEGLIKLGYTTLELNNNFGKLLNTKTPVNFDGIEVELGTRVQYINESFKLILGSNFKKIFDERDFHILENGFEIIYSLTEVTPHSKLGYEDPYKDYPLDGRPIIPGAGTSHVDAEILNFTLFGNYNLYSTNNTTTAVPIVGLKLKVYYGLFADR